MLYSEKKKGVLLVKKSFDNLYLINMICRRFLKEYIHLLGINKNNLN